MHQPLSCQARCFSDWSRLFWLPSCQLTAATSANCWREPQRKQGRGLYGRPRSILRHLGAAPSRSRSWHCKQTLRYAAFMEGRDLLWTGGRLCPLFRASLISATIGPIGSCIRRFSGARIGGSTRRLICIGWRVVGRRYHNSFLLVPDREEW